MYTWIGCYLYAVCDEVVLRLSAFTAASKSLWEVVYRGQNRPLKQSAEKGMRMMQRFKNSRVMSAYTAIKNCLLASAVV